jgi:dipeptidyl aminopeptidase/acylaminoacyl peptidase
MTRHRATSLVAALTVLGGTATACSGSSDEPVSEAAPGRTIVFETGVPGAGDACDGLWAANVSGGRARFIVAPRRGADGRDEEPAIPSIAMDGQTVAFGLSGEGYEFDVYTLAAPSGSVNQVASRTGVLFVRQWSPASDALLTLRFREGKGWELVVLRPDGDSQVVDEEATTIDYDWSPDGERIAFSETDRERKSDHLFVVKADGDDRHEVAELEEDDATEAFPTWSPDGRTIAYFRGGDLWLVSANGENARLLARGPAPEQRGVFWLPHGNELLLVREPQEPANNDYVKDLVRVDVRSGSVTPHFKGVVPVALSPTGKELLFLRLHRNVPVPGGIYVPVNMYSIRVASLDGGDERTVGVMSESVLRHGSRPVWQPQAGPIVAATGAFRPRRATYCSSRLEAYRRRLDR